MSVSFVPTALHGEITAVSSKSELHRRLIASALSDTASEIFCHGTAEDVQATAAGLCALGARIEKRENSFFVTPIARESLPGRATVDCRESGSTLRFLVPLCAALGVPTTFLLHGRLAERPMQPFLDLLSAHGVHAVLSAQAVHLDGRLRGGAFSVPGNITSQYVTGLLLALPLLQENSTVSLLPPVESKPYIDLTVQVLTSFGIPIENTESTYALCPSPYAAPKVQSTAGDWSAAANFLAAGALGGPVTVSGLDFDSVQGDCKIIDLLQAMGAKTEVKKNSACVYPSALHGIRAEVSDTPDLVPILAVLAAAAEGESFLHGVQRLRYKESDRLSAIQLLLDGLGVQSRLEENTLHIFGRAERFSGHTFSFWDHRMAMAAAIASVYAKTPVTLDTMDCVRKSYPQFSEDFKTLGGQCYGIGL